MCWNQEPNIEITLKSSNRLEIKWKFCTKCFFPHRIQLFSFFYDLNTTFSEFSERGKTIRIALSKWNGQRIYNKMSYVCAQPIRDIIMTRYIILTTIDMKTFSL